MCSRSQKLVRLEPRGWLSGSRNGIGKTRSAPPPPPPPPDRTERLCIFVTRPCSRAYCLGQVIVFYFQEMTRYTCIVADAPHSITDFAGQRVAGDRPDKRKIQTVGFSAEPQILARSCLDVLLIGPHALSHNWDALHPDIHILSHVEKSTTVFRIQGYMLRPRLRSGWTPSWLTTGKSRLYFEDSARLPVSP